MARRPAAVTDRRVFYLVATSGHPNYGDELILRRWLRLLAKIAPDAQVWIDTPEPGLTAALFHTEHPGLQTTNILYRLCWESSSADPVEVRRHVLAALDDPGRAPRLVAGLRLLRSIDVFHIVGGGYLNSLWPQHLGLVAVGEWLAANTGAVVGATGLGLLPASTGVEEVWASSGRAFDVLTVRDVESFSMLEAQGVTVGLGPDDAFLGGLAGVYDTTPGAPDFMVCVQMDMHSVEPESLAEAVRKTLSAWGATPERTGFVECIPRVDRVIYDALADEFSASRFYSLWDMVDHGFPARAGQRWISSRYHPHILAAAAGAEGVALELGEGYYGIKHRAVRAFGSGWRISGLADLVGDPGHAGALSGRIEQLSRSVLASARRLYSV